MITDTARGRKLSYAQLGMAICAASTPSGHGLRISQILNLFKPSSTNSSSDRNDRMKAEKADDPNDIWRVHSASRAWFQGSFQL